MSSYSAAILAVFAFVSVSVSVIWTAQARAADPSEDDLIHEGVESRKRGDDATALELFRKAYEMHKRPRAAAQVGLAEVALGRWVEAETHLEEALSAETDLWIETNVEPLKSTLARVQEQLGSLDVVGSPAGAEVIIEGAARGTLPLSKPLRVRTGDCQFIVRAAGHEPLSRVVRISTGELTRETVNLSSRVVGAMPPPSVSADQSVKTSPSGALVVAQGSKPTAVSGGRLRMTGLVLGGAGVAALGAGLAFGLKARSAGRSDSNRSMFDVGTDDTGHRYQTLQYVGYGIGAALLAGGAAFYILGPGRRAGSSTAVSFTPVSGGAIAGMTWSL
jgi:tetratricopeptide (TPR) repeat protein